MSVTSDFCLPVAGKGTFHSALAEASLGAGKSGLGGGNGGCNATMLLQA